MITKLLGSALLSEADMEEVAACNCGCGCGGQSDDYKAGLKNGTSEETAKP